MRTSQASESSDDHFGSLSPSLTLTYLLDPQQGHMLLLQTERGTEQIPYSAISNFRRYQTPNLYIVGNPALRTPINWQVVGMLQLWQ